jgi:hypothetical protein
MKSFTQYIREEEDTIEKLAKKHDVSTDVIKKELKMGIEVEKEHTKDPDIARKIALDHLAEVPDYYTKLNKYVEPSLEEANVKEIAAKAYAAAKKSGAFYKKYIHPVVKRLSKISFAGSKIMLNRVVYPLVKSLAKMILKKMGLYDEESREMEKLLNAMIDEILMDQQTQSMFAMESIQELRRINEDRGRLLT